MNESLLLQETGSGYFTLETGEGRLLLEVSVPAAPGGSNGAPLLDEQMERLLIMLRRDDEELALVASLL